MQPVQSKADMLMLHRQITYSYYACVAAPLRLGLIQCQQSLFSMIQNSAENFGDKQ